MRNSLGTAEEEMLEECIEALDEVTDALSRFPDAVIAYALRAHLGALLSALLEREIWSCAAAREFVDGLQDDVLGTCDSRTDQSDE